MNDQILIGVDFSSAPTKRKPITVAVGRLQGHRRLTYELETIRELASLAAFDAMLAESGSWLGGLIFPLVSREASSNMKAGQRTGPPLSASIVSSHGSHFETRSAAGVTPDP